MASQRWAEDEGRLDDAVRHERIESQSADGKNLVKVVVEFRTDGDKKVKVTSRVKVTKKMVRVNKSVKERRAWRKFGASAGAAAGVESGVTAIAEEVFLEVPTIMKSEEKTSGATTMNVVCRRCGGDHWTRKCPVPDDALPNAGEGGAGGDTDEFGAALAAAAAGAGAGGGAGEKGGDRKAGSYVPPHLRGREGGGGGGGGDRDRDRDREDKATVRVTNLSEDTIDSDLHELFRPHGHIARVSLPKDRITNLPRGFAFIDFYSMADAQRAIDKLHGTGFNSLILNVEWAK